MDNYVFMIDRISDDGDTVFARYSFQLQVSCYEIMMRKPSARKGEEEERHR